MIIEEDQVSTNVEQAHNGAIADLRIMRRPENVSEANLAQVFAVYLQGCLSPVKLCHNLIDTEDQNYGPQTSLRRGHIEAVA